ncbi:alpha/beta fold hydrolase [Zunongwangia sp.]|uniref:alpha/beta fold hydrolase n=1 Tax=Zunongwangia sp. TaxID=1965325 RepID=UPI003AA9E1F9
MKLHVNTIGQGRPFVILHGFLGMGDNWKTLGKMFSDEGYEVHLLDQRNHGKSPHSDEFNYQLLVEDLKEYCSENNLKHIVLLGHSMGGKTAMLAATLYPDLIDKLIIVDIAPKYYEPHHQQILKGLTLLDEADLSSRREAESLMADYVPDKPTQLFLLKNLQRDGKENFKLKINLPALKSNIDNIGEGLSEEKSYDGATLFIKGGKSGYIKLPEDEALIKKHFPNSEIVPIDGAGHWVHAENQKEFFKQVMRFI